jgi:hypothetical protein
MVLPLNNGTAIAASAVPLVAGDSQHKCFGCERFIHGICGTPCLKIPERSICYANDLLSEVVDKRKQQLLPRITTEGG